MRYFACLMLLALAGCQVIDTEDYYETGDLTRETREALVSAMHSKGMFGHHKLVRLTGVVSPAGDVTGSWNIFRGRARGNMGAAGFALFAWSPEPSVISVSTVPLNNIMIYIDNSLAVPTIRFKFDLNFIRSNVRSYRPDAQGYSKGLRVNVPHGKFLEGKCLVNATIRISEQDLNESIYLKFF